MGPMRAARRFAVELEATGVLARVAEVRVELYGSLALTGLGHGTDRAVLLGLSGEEAATIDPATIEPKLVEIRSSGRLVLLGTHSIPFREPKHLIFHRDQMFPPGAVTQHPNGVRFTALRCGGICADDRHLFFDWRRVYCRGRRGGASEDYGGTCDCPIRLRARRNCWRWRRRRGWRFGS
jgi:L-serine dehydratase